MDRVITENLTKYVCTYLCIEKTRCKSLITPRGQKDNNHVPYTQKRMKKTEKRHNGWNEVSKRSESEWDKNSNANSNSSVLQRTCSDRIDPPASLVDRARVLPPGSQYWLRRMPAHAYTVNLRSTLRSKSLRNDVQSHLT